MKNVGNQIHKFLFVLKIGDNVHTWEYIIRVSELMDRVPITPRMFEDTRDIVRSELTKEFIV